MGRSFHVAATVPDLIYGVMPYSLAIALMIGLLGWFLVQPKAPQPVQHATARMRRFEDGL
jgi:ABC-type microcin C transport system permease subunit YejB